MKSLAFATEPPPDEAPKPAAHQLIHSSNSVEWYTPAKYIEAVRSVLTEIDLDPASCEEANKVVQARRYFSLERQQDGLKETWGADTVYCNCPYGRGVTEAWVNKMIVEYYEENFKRGILLINNTTDSSWFGPLWQLPICFTNHRIKFNCPEGKKSSPTHGNAFVLFPSKPYDKWRFDQVFSQFGHVVFPR